MAFENSYSRTERLLHKMAFSSWGLQASLADIEDRMFAQELAGIDVQKPVFVSALPRGGTTILLELIESSGEFAAHRYRDMPFLMVPMIWSTYAKGFRTDDTARERAHGDGMLVSVDSPEAFEEVLWRTFFKHNYGQKTIRPFDATRDAEFDRFFPQHIRKIIALRRRDGGKAERYLSKNNLNIARMPLIKAMLPDALVLTPFRPPVQHAASLLRQHLNFLDIHEQDEFARDYMESIGHYDFGENLKPVNFGNWFDTVREVSRRTLNFWLRYWVATYSTLIEQSAPGMHFIAYERLCERPTEGLGRIGEILGLKDSSALMAQSSRLKAAKPYDVPADVDPQLLKTAEDLYQRLLEAAL